MLEYFTTIQLTAVYLLVFILGTVMGSALNCLCFRIARHEKWSGNERSRCPKCGHVLNAIDLIPVLGWLIRGGKCHWCRERISPRYLITEVTLGLIYPALLWRNGLSVEFACQAVLCSCLFALSLCDLDTGEIPDRFIIIPAAVRLLYVGTAGWVSGGFTGCLGECWYVLWHGLALGGGILLLSLFMDKVLGRDSMGGGDIKLLFMLGLWFDIGSCLILLLFSCIIGLVCAAIMLRRSAQDSGAVPMSSDPVGLQDAKDATTASDAAADKECAEGPVGTVSSEIQNTESSENVKEEEEEDTSGRFPFGPAIAAAAFICLLCATELLQLYFSFFI